MRIDMSIPSSGIQRMILLKQNGNKKEPCSIFFIRIDFFIAIIRQVTGERKRERESSQVAFDKADFSVLQYATVNIFTNSETNE